MWTGLICVVLWKDNTWMSGTWSGKGSWNETVEHYLDKGTTKPKWVWAVGRRVEDILWGCRVMQYYKGGGGGGGEAVPENQERI